MKRSYVCPNCQANLRSSLAFVRHLLEEAGPHGVTTNEFLRAGAGSRFGARIFDLRHKHGLDITEHGIDGGSVYRLAAQPSGRTAAADTGMAAPPALHSPPAGSAAGQLTRNAIFGWEDAA